MAKDIIPLVNDKTYSNAVDTDVSIAMHNVIATQIDKQSLALTARPTFAVDTSSETTGQGRGCYYWQYHMRTGSGGTGGILEVVDDTWYTGITPYSYTMSDIHTDSRAYFNQDSSDQVYVLNPAQDRIATHSSPPVGSLYYRGIATTPSAITLPTGVKPAHGLVALNGRLYIVDITGAVYNSNLDDGTTWDSTDFITAERKNDNGVFIAKHREHLAVFGNKTLEFFYDAGNSPNSPLARRQDIFYNIGTLFPNAVQVVGDVIYFIGIDYEDSSIGVYKLKDFQLARVSTNLIDEILLSAVSGSMSGAESVNYSVMAATIRYTPEGAYIVFTVDSNNTLVYDTVYQLWYKWSLGGEPAAANGQYSTFTGILPLIGDSAGFGSGAVVMFDNGQLATFTGTGLEDIGVTAAEAYVYTPFWDKNTNERKKISAVRLIHNALTTDEATDPTVEIDWSDDLDGVTSFTGGRTVTTNSNRARLYRCGTTRQRMFKVTLDQTNGHKQILKGLELDYEQLRG